MKGGFERGTGLGWFGLNYLGIFWIILKLRLSTYNDIIENNHCGTRKANNYSNYNLNENELNFVKSNLYFIRNYRNKIFGRSYFDISHSSLRENFGKLIQEVYIFIRDFELLFFEITWRGFRIFLVVFENRFL